MLGTDVKKSENGGVGTSALTISVIVTAEARSSARKTRCGAARLHLAPKLVLSQNSCVSHLAKKRERSVPSALHNDTAVN